MARRRNFKGLTSEEQRALKEFAFRLRDRFPREIVSIKLYGSKARGDAGEDSDIDLLVLVQKRHHDFDEVLLDLVCNILNEFGVFLETVTMSSDDYEKAKQQQYPFTINVERESIPL